jgi:Dolichyl-phosphate-mannose-protein mannosyltransferase
MTLSNSAPTKLSSTTRCWPGLLLLVASLIIALFIYKDYGVSWDEPEQREMGEVSYNYIFHHDPALKTSVDRDHGVGFELVLTALEKKLHFTDSRDIFLMRHLATHIFFLIGVFFAYLLMLRLYKNQFIACLGFLIIALNPRLYAHSFFNTKDIPFLSAFIICLFLCHVAFDKNKSWWYALLGVACGYATSIRILGVLLISLIALFILIDMLRAFNGKTKTAKSAGNLFIFFTASFLSLTGFWPVLWESPLQTFASNFRSLSHFPWDGLVLFNGHLDHAKTLPWYYLPEWFFISTPLLWLTTGIAGITMVVLRFIKSPFNYVASLSGKSNLLYLLCFFTPLLSIIVLHSVVYDDWRHVYFIYPPFVFLALSAIHKFNACKGNIIACAICMVQLVLTGFFMISNHPCQNVYFNSLVSHKDEHIRMNFEQDYWGSSFKQGIEYILAHDTSSTIRLDWRIRPVKTNVRILKEADRKRIQFTEDSADYFITTFRGHPSDYKYPSITYEVKVQNSTMLRVYKLR